MDDYLQFTGPVKLLIIEQAILLRQKKGRREGEKKVLTKLVYDQQGRAVSELRESSYLEYTYNDEDLLSNLIERDKSGSIIEEIKYTYSNNQLIEMTRKSADGTIRENRSYKSNDNKQIILEKCGSRNYRYEYENDHLSREYRYYGKDPELALLYSYDDLNNCTAIKTVDKDGQLIREENSSYKDGLITEKKITQGNGKILTHESFEYDCYHEGNWLKRIRYNILDDGLKDPVEIIYRSIAYSDTCPPVKPIEEKQNEVLKEESQSLTFSDGSLYKGDISNGRMEGIGFILWPDGSSYKGEFKNNHMEGKGILTWPNGDTYSGEFSLGKMDGIGRMTWASGKTFYGLFEDNRRTRQGIIEEDHFDTITS